MTRRRLFSWIQHWRAGYLSDLNRRILSRKVIGNKKTRSKLEAQGWPKGLDPITGSDIGSIVSMRIMEHWARALPGSLGEMGTAQRSGATYESLLVSHLNLGFESLARDFGIGAAVDLKAAQVGAISSFDQYSHLATIDAKLKSDPGLENVFGRNYNISPDVVVYKQRNDVNRWGGRVGSNAAALTPFFVDAAHAVYQETEESGFGRSDIPLLQAIVSCKFSIRSDRAQNIRTEAMTAIRMRKGRVPHMVALTAEPKCSGGRLDSIAQGTGELDCVYHSALPELKAAMQEAGANDEHSILDMMIRQRRIRDVSDLLFDLLN